MNKFYLTTSIAYVNAPPHVGFALELAQGDVIARYRKLLGSDVYYLTGTDEHGQKIAKAAEATGKDPAEFVDHISESFRALTKDLNISNNDFIRKSDKNKHWPGASEMWRALSDSGTLYKKDYDGLYCEGCEAFKALSDLTDGMCPDHKKKPEIIKEENYFFRLSDYQDKLLKLYEEGVIKIIPEHRQNEVNNFIKQGLEDVSFSRPRKDLPWGIPVPGDEDHTIYVWADALVNYISALGYGRGDSELFNKFWPADLHIIGKDILRFHAIIWPAMLFSAELPLPKSILVHGHIQSGGQKMSKSLGNVIDPFELINKYGADAVRYFLIKEIPTTEDGDMTKERMADIYSSELANGLGNLVARVAAIAEKNFTEIIVSDDIFKEKTELVWQKYAENIENYKLNDALQNVFSLVREGNTYIDREKPWEGDNAKNVIPNIVYLIINIGWLLMPFMPDTAEKILKQYGVDINDGKSWEKEKLHIIKGESLFPRV